MQLFTSPPNRNFAPVVISQEVPVYRIAGQGFHCDDELIPAGTIIEFDDEPSMDMEPLNKLAMEKMREFLTKLDNLGRKKSEKDNTAFISALDAFDAIYAPKNGAKRASVVGAKKDASILGAPRQQTRVSKVEMQEVQTPMIIDKSGRGRKAANATTDTGLNKDEQVI